MNRFWIIMYNVILMNSWGIWSIFKGLKIVIPFKYSFVSPIPFWSPSYLSPGLKHFAHYNGNNISIRTKYYRCVPWNIFHDSTILFLWGSFSRIFIFTRIFLHLHRQTTQLPAMAGWSSLTLAAIYLAMRKLQCLHGSMGVYLVLIRLVWYQ